MSYSIALKPSWMTLSKRKLNLIESIIIENYIKAVWLMYTFNY